MFCIFYLCKPMQTKAGFFGKIGYQDSSFLANVLFCRFLPHFAVSDQVYASQFTNH